MRDTQFSILTLVLLGALSAKRWLDAETGVYVLKHIDTLRMQTMIDLNFESGSMQVPSPTGSSPNSKNNPRLMILVGILGVLLLFLILFLFLRH